MGKKLSDKKKVLNHLMAHGDITPMEALSRYGCYRLGARIFDLRKEGYDIETKQIPGVDKFGEPVRVTVYVLRGDVQTPAGTC